MFIHTYCHVHKYFLQKKKTVKMSNNIKKSEMIVNHGPVRFERIPSK